MNLTYFWIVLILPLMIGVVHVKNIVTDMDKQLSDINSSRQQEEAIIYELNTKWAILTRPDRISNMAETLLKMQEPDFKKLSTLSAIPLKQKAAAKKVIPLSN